MRKLAKSWEDAFLVMTHLETKQSNLIKIQADETEKLRVQIAEQRRLNQETDKRIADLVSAIGPLIGKMPQPGGQR